MDRGSVRGMDVSAYIIYITGIGSDVYISSNIGMDRGIYIICVVCLHGGIWKESVTGTGRGICVVSAVCVSGIEACTCIARNMGMDAGVSSATIIVCIVFITSTVKGMLQA
jgi:hypothetical protein